VRTEAGRRPDVGAPPGRRTAGLVVHEGVGHIVIDVLPREVTTFRTVCGRDVLDHEQDTEPATMCTWCLRVERTWVLVKAAEVI
jgi:hypothetical protein